MKKLILGAMAALVMTTGAALSDVSKFYRKDSGAWTVEGIKDDKLVYCAASTFWGNGDESFFTLYITADKETNIIIHNTAWNIGDPAGHYKGYSAKFSFFGDSSPFQGDADYELQDAQTIVIPNVTRNFYEQWIKYSVLNIVMPGDISTINLNLKGTSDALTYMADCTNQMENKSSSNGQSL